MSLFPCQFVVSKDFVTCPSCLHTYSVPSAPGSLMDLDEVDCFSRRKDEKVCCRNGGWVDSTRYCHYPSAASVDYSKYTTCESACRRDQIPNSQYAYGEAQYYVLCKDAVSGSRKATMTATPSSETQANEKAWCECVEKCLRCTGSSGGIGERPTQMASLNPEYRLIHGTCAPPPASWITSTVADIPPPPNAIFQATAFQCDAKTPSGTFLLPIDMILYLMRPPLIHERARAHTHTHMRTCACFGSRGLQATEHRHSLQAIVRRLPCLCPATRVQLITL